MYSSDNIAFAAFLLRKGERLTSVSRTGRRVWWHFGLSEEAADLIYTEWLSSGESTFFSKYLSLKAEMKVKKRRH